MQLEEWRGEIGLHLHVIENCAETAARHVGKLISQPPFATLAYDELTKLEEALSAALAKVRAAKAAFREKPID